MKKYKNFTLEELKERFFYEETTGNLVWKVGRFKGRVAGSVLESNGGYVYLCLSKGGKPNQLLGHRVVWAFVHGDFPPDNMYIDHIDGNTANNRKENLRLVTSRGNARNRGKRKVKASVESRYVLTAIPGIRYDKKESCYVVTGDREVLGKTLDYDDAKYLRWNWEFDNGYHQNHGVK